MIAKAVAYYVRCSPRKARQVGRLIKGKRCPEAQAMLRFLNKRSASFVGKALASALASATRQPAVREEELVVEAVRVNEGPRWKRFKAGAMGRAMPRLRRMCHITIELGLEK